MVALTDTSTKPTSNILKGYGLKEHSALPSTTADYHALRDNFRTSTWLLIGASLQCLLLALPIRPSYALLPALLLLGYRFTSGLLMCFGIIKHPYMDGVIVGKTAAAMPESYDIDGKRKDDGGLCVILLFGRCNRSIKPYLSSGLLKLTKFIVRWEYLRHITNSLQSTCNPSYTTSTAMRLTMAS